MGTPRARFTATYTRGGRGMGSDDPGENALAHSEGAVPCLESLDATRFGVRKAHQIATSLSLSLSLSLSGLAYLGYLRVGAKMYGTDR